MGNRACAFTTLPITAVFVILGKSIIEVWVGKKYVAQGYLVLLTLIFPYTLMLIQHASGRVLFGISKHGKLAVSHRARRVCKSHSQHIAGKALWHHRRCAGTAIPLLGTYILFMPFHLCSRLGIRVSTFLRQAYLLPLMLCAPVVAVLLLMQRWFVAHTYRQLAVQLLAGGLVYGTCIAGHP